MPTVRDPDRYMYIRGWSGGILAGFADRNGKSCFQDGIPESFEFQLLPEDWDHIRKINLTPLVVRKGESLYILPSYRLRSNHAVYCTFSNRTEAKKIISNHASVRLE